jgi:hypothetical protein
MSLDRGVVDHHSTALGYHRRLPLRIRTYLTETRGLSDDVICRFLLGWNGFRITIRSRTATARTSKLPVPISDRSLADAPLFDREAATNTFVSRTKAGYLLQRQQPQ